MTLTIFWMGIGAFGIAALVSGAFALDRIARALESLVAIERQRNSN